MLKVSYFNQRFLLLNQQSLELFHQPIHEINWSEKTGENQEEIELIGAVHQYLFEKKRRAGE